MRLSRLSQQNLGVNRPYLEDLSETVWCLLPIFKKNQRGFSEGGKSRCVGRVVAAGSFQAKAQPTVDTQHIYRTQHSSCQIARGVACHRPSKSLTLLSVSVAGSASINIHVKPKVRGIFSNDLGFQYFSHQMNGPQVLEGLELRTHSSLVVALLP